MAVSKRTRFEVLRRDDFTCRYCRSRDNELTIDHVVPVALGGSDAPDNLVAACRDCNAGKSSIAPDAAFVADVAADALRWARAIALAAAKAGAESSERRDFLTYLEGEWDGQVGAPVAEDWETSAWGFFTRGLPMEEFDDALHVTARANVPRHARWKYFCGVCWNKLRAIEASARAAIDAGEVH